MRPKDKSGPRWHSCSRSCPKGPAIVQRARVNSFGAAKRKPWFDVWASKGCLTCIKWYVQKKGIPLKSPGWSSFFPRIIIAVSWGIPHFQAQSAGAGCQSKSVSLNERVSHANELRIGIQVILMSRPINQLPFKLSCRPKRHYNVDHHYIIAHTHTPVK